MNVPVKDVKRENPATVIVPVIKQQSLFIYGYRKKGKEFMCIFDLISVFV